MLRNERGASLLLLLINSWIFVRSRGPSSVLLGKHMRPCGSRVFEGTSTEPLVKELLDQVACPNLPFQTTGTLPRSGSMCPRVDGEFFLGGRGGQMPSGY